MANEVIINVKANTDKAKTGLESMRSSMKKVGAAATIAGAAIIALGAASLKSFSSAGDEVNKMSLRTGYGTEALSELRLAAELSGTSLAALETGVRRMQMSVVDAGRGVKLSVDAFDALGLSVDAIKQLSPEEQFDKMTVALAGIDDVAIRTKTAMDLFGRAGTQLLPMLAGGKEGLEDMKQQAHDLGLVFDKEAAAKAARLTDAMTTMKGSLSGVMMVIAEALAPSISQMAEKIGEVVSRISAWAEENPKLFKLIVIITGAIGAFLAVLGPVLIAISMISAILPALGIAFGILTGPIGLVVLAITGLALAFKNNLFGIRDLAVRLFDNITGIISKVVNWLIEKINSMIDAVNHIGGFFGQNIPHLDEMASSLLDLGKDAANAAKEFVGLGEASNKATDAIIEDRGRLEQAASIQPFSGEDAGGILNPALASVGTAAGGGRSVYNPTMNQQYGTIAGAYDYEANKKFWDGMKFFTQQNAAIQTGDVSGESIAKALTLIGGTREYTMDNAGNVHLAHEGDQTASEEQELGE